MNVDQFTDQQLVARIVRKSKYWGQTAPDAWFAVRIARGDHYCVRGNANAYRLEDVILGVVTGGAIVQITSKRLTS